MPTDEVGPGTAHHQDRARAFEAYFREQPLPGVICRVMRDAAGRAADLVIVEANDAIASKPGTSPRALPGTRIADLIGAAFLEPYLPLIDEVLETGAPFSRETVPSPGSGSYESTVYRVGPDLVAVVSMDSTARKAAEAALRMSEAHHRAALDALQTGVVVQDTEGAIITASASAARILGLAVDELTQRTTFDPRWQARRADGTVFPGDEHPTMVAMRTGQPVRDVLMELSVADGRRVWLIINAEPLRDAQGRVTSVVASFEDITERRQAEEALALQTQALQRTMADLVDAREIAGLGVWRRDIGTGEGEWSPQMFRLFGIDPGGPVPTLAQVEAMLGPEALRRRAEAMVEGARTGMPWELEAEIHPPGGDSRWIVWRGMSDVDRDGRLVSLRGTALDVTVRKRAELVLREFSAELEQRVVARTAALEAANEDLRSFTYSVSHDLRAPVRSIAGFARILELHYADRLDEGGLHRLRNIIEAGETMGRVIDDLLAYSRLGHHAIVTRPVPLEPIVAEVRLACSAALAESDGTLEVIEPLAVPIGDPTLLAAILQNLVSNALTYRRPDVFPKVVISSTRTDHGVTIKVLDNCVGMPVDVLDRVFEPFFRLATDATHPGSGIGLAIVRRSARLMDGEVTVTSEPGVGSTFSVVLPAA